MQVSQLKHAAWLLAMMACGAAYALPGEQVHQLQPVADATIFAIATGAPSVIDRDSVSDGQGGAVAGHHGHRTLAACVHAL